MEKGDSITICRYLGRRCGAISLRRERINNEIQNKEFRISFIFAAKILTRIQPGLFSVKKLLKSKVIACERQENKYGTKAYFKGPISFIIKYPLGY